MIRLLLTVFLSSLLAGCGSQPYYNTPPDTAKTHKNNRLLDIAQQQRGVRYRYGGNHPREGFDCSGFIQFSFAQIGKRIPRTTLQQFKRRTPIAISQIQPGDLLFYETEGRRPGHVALYLGQGKMIHAPSSGKQVSITRLDNPYWRKRLIGAGYF